MTNKEAKTYEAMKDNEETDNEAIAEQVKEGNTSGILDNEAGYRISWELSVNKFIK